MKGQGPSKYIKRQQYLRESVDDEKKKKKKKKKKKSCSRSGRIASSLLFRIDGSTEKQRMM
jgi:hypothetical protein